MTKKFTTRRDLTIKWSSSRSLFLLAGIMIMSFSMSAQISVNCLYPFVPTDCSPCIDPSENMVNVQTDCNQGYTLNIGDPVLVSGFGNCPGATYTVTYTATDNCNGASASCSQTWVMQNEDPTLICPMDLYLDCGDPYNDIYIDYWLNSVQGETSCMIGSNMFNTYNPNWINGPCPSGFQTVTWFLTDNCGRTTSCSATVFVLDHDLPVLIKEASDTIVVCNYNDDHVFQDWLDSNGGALAEDACSNLSWSTDPPNPQLPLACEEVEVTFTATDGCGWQISTTASFKLIDCHPPVITGQPSDVTIECTEDVQAALADWLANNGGATAIDECGTFSWMTDPLDPELSDDCGETGSVTVIFIAKDNCWNFAETNPATFTVVDTEAPIFVEVPDDETIECSDTIVFGEPVVVDSCGDFTLTFEDVTKYQVEGGFNGNQEVPPSGSNGGGTALGRYYPATGEFSIDVDFNGLSGLTTAAHIHNAPVGSNGPVVYPLSIPEGVSGGNFSFDVTLTADEAAELEAGNFYINIHTDAVPSGEIRAQLFVKTCIGMVTRTWTATDDCGNSSTASQMISFSDTEPPVATDVPDDITVDCDENWEFGDDPTWTDNCDEDPFTSVEDITITDDPDFCIVYERHWSAIDDCGNLATVKQRVFVTDTVAPVFTFIPDVLDIDCVVEPYPWVEPEAEDNCGNVTLTFVEEDPNGDICDIGTSITRVYTATDDCGNSVSTEVILWINPDQGPPVFTFVPDDLTFYCDNGDTIDDIPDATAEDDCDPNVVITFEDEYNTDPDDCGNGYGYDVFRTWIATDHCGNVTTAEAFYWFKGPFSFNGDDNHQDVANNVRTGAGNLTISPNPVSSQLNISFTAPIEQTTNIRVHNILGEQVLSQAEVAISGNNFTELSVAQLIPGTYLISIELEDSVLTKKFIKR